MRCTWHFLSEGQAQDHEGLECSDVQHDEVDADLAQPGVVREGLEG